MNLIKAGTGLSGRVAKKKKRAFGMKPITPAKNIIQRKSVVASKPKRMVMPIGVVKPKNKVSIPPMTPKKKTGGTVVRTLLGRKRR